MREEIGGKSRQEPLAALVEAMAQQRRRRIRPAPLREPVRHDRAEPAPVVRDESIARDKPRDEQHDRDQCLAPERADRRRPVLDEETDEPLAQPALLRTVEIEIAPQRKRFEITDERLVQRGRTRERQRRERRTVEQRQREQFLLAQAARRTLLDARQQRLERRPVRLAFSAKARERLAQRAGRRVHSASSRLSVR